MTTSPVEFWQLTDATLSPHFGTCERTLNLLPP
eukprot:CAMPEP_0118717758 /NCGR_PEP_ID=MMETSP0800-20121206/28362_1 /TAXON_ID=210618 ORGANISM="Striatella unipunctata, Strain CCMP2910" /NCGR_SAMPLE_ID=MMETSP0800 /ASSEMBLY_ACC=CAM_ASM_000638 /LENGTH=32 /DNA_ID= /DNA_START= /DNA_END= /DNA_ORIENTATION=